MRIICKHNTDGCSICEGELAIALEALEKVQGQIAALVDVLDEIRWPLTTEPACAGHRVRAKTDLERIQMADDALEGRLPRLKLSPATLSLAKKMREAQGKLEAVEVVINDDTSAASGVRHEVRASYMNPPHTTVDVSTCRSDCPRCALDRILSKEGE